jgi:rare lipoprotein A (peptidoglycan hydrolase)
VGRSGRHRQTDTPKTLRIALIAAAGLAAVALAAIVVSVTGPGSSSAQLNSRGALADPPRPLDRASRDDPRTALATPTPEPTETQPEQAPPKKKRQHRKILSRGACEASYYGSGGRTASGESFDRDALTAAHKTLPIGSKVRVTNRHNDRSVVVRINDRGPFVAGRCLDLSSAAMQAVGGLGSGVIPVKYEVLAQV